MWGFFLSLFDCQNNTGMLPEYISSFALCCHLSSQESKLFFFFFFFFFLFVCLLKWSDFLHNLKGQLFVCGLYFYVLWHLAKLCQCYLVNFLRYIFYDKSLLCPALLPAKEQCCSISCHFLLLPLLLTVKATLVVLTQGSISVGHLLTAPPTLPVSLLSTLRPHYLQFYGPSM